MYVLFIAEKMTKVTKGISGVVKDFKANGLLDINRTIPSQEIQHLKCNFWSYTLSKKVKPSVCNQCVCKMYY